MEPTTARGRLTIYLGAAPGVGKTYAMLERAQALRRAGTDVVVGVALTHGRAETAALTNGLEQLPPRRRDHHGAVVEEFDLDAALKRRPAVLLLDELAHTNAPGSRHAKRWQDVDDLLAVGIDVLTALNVQHVESRHDVVARLTGISVRERVPDAVLERAHAIELIDLPSDELLARLASGHVYLGEGAERARAGFFTPANLTGLRELALRLVAELVQARQAETGMARSRQPAERLLVAIGPSPTSAQLVRATKRMADATSAPWLAVFAETPDSLGLDAQARARVADHLRLAESLGAETLTVTGNDAVHALIETARRHGVRRLVVGKPTRGRWRDLWRGSLVHDLVRLSGDLEVLAISSHELPHDTQTAPVTNPTAADSTWYYAVAIGAVLLATLVALPLRAHLQPANLTLPFLLAVVVTALFGRRGPTIAATAIGVLMFDVVCVPPYWSLAVSDAEYLLTFIGMLAVGLTIAHLVASLRRQTDGALATAYSAQGLHRLGADLATTRGVDALVRHAAARCGELLGCPAVIVLTDGPGQTTISAAAALVMIQDDAMLPAADLAVAQWVVTHGQAAGIGTDTLPGAAGLHVPLLATNGVVGVLVLRHLTAARWADLDWRRAVEAAARMVALALECERLELNAREARLTAEGERLRATLLASVSHDLRTPLTAIAGLAHQLSGETVSHEERRSAATTIASEAERLARCVRNLLDLTRLAHGQVRPNRVQLAAEDAIATAVAACRARLGKRPVLIQVAADCPALDVDEVMLHTALGNLLDNALAHAPGESPITITATTSLTNQVRITVADHGPGIPRSERERVLKPFERGLSARIGGTGLGLAIVQAIVIAHGGEVQLGDNSGGEHAGSGLAITITLPSHA